jgi:hypothetical protein
MTNQAIKMTVTKLDLCESARQQKIAALAYEFWLAGFPKRFTRRGLAPGGTKSTRQGGDRQTKANNGGKLFGVVALHESISGKSERPKRFRLFSR